MRINHFLRVEPPKGGILIELHERLMRFEKVFDGQTLFAEDDPQWAMCNFGLLFWDGGFFDFGNLYKFFKARFSKYPWTLSFSLNYCDPR